MSHYFQFKNFDPEHLSSELQDYVTRTAHRIRVLAPSSSWAGEIERVQNGFWCSVDVTLARKSVRARSFAATPQAALDELYLRIQQKLRRFVPVRVARESSQAPFAS